MNIIETLNEYECELGEALEIILDKQTEVLETGSYRPATDIDPEEIPDLEIVLKPGIHIFPIGDSGLAGNLTRVDVNENQVEFIPDEGFTFTTVIYISVADDKGSVGKFKIGYDQGEVGDIVELPVDAEGGK